MDIGILVTKAQARIWAKIVATFRSNFLFHMLYGSWWHSLLHKGDKTAPQHGYLAGRPHPGAGIGHQMANWIAGLWFARKFGLEHAHFPFPSREWERLLGFGESATTTGTLLVNGYQRVCLPIFDEDNMHDVQRIQTLISSYQGKKVVFVLEQDQFYRDQFGVIDDLQRRFYTATARRSDRLEYHREYFNVALHVRRGDITQGLDSKIHNLTMRWQNVDYFRNVLVNVLAHIETSRLIRIYLFSQGTKDEFADFESLGEVKYCLEMDACSSFLHMVHADLLITSKSSFSYKPALLSRGIKVCPRHFWHGYPEGGGWILAEQDGSLTSEAATQLLDALRRSELRVVDTTLINQTAE